MKAYVGEKPLTHGDVVLELTASEALVFFDWLHRRNERKVEPLLLPAEQRVLWDLECVLESVLVEPLMADYLARVEKARASIE